MIDGISIGSSALQTNPPARSQNEDAQSTSKSTSNDSPPSQSTQKADSVKLSAAYATAAVLSEEASESAQQEASENEDAKANKINLLA